MNRADSAGSASAAVKLAATACAFVLALVPHAGPVAGARQAKASSAFAAAGSPADSPAAFEFEMNGFSYRVAANGNGRRTKGDRTRRFNLRLEGLTHLTRRVYFAEYEGDLLLAYDVTDGQFAGARVTRLMQPAMRALWNSEVPRGGAGTPVREGRFLYVTAAGFVGKLDLRSGEFAWAHEDLMGRGRKGAFNSFDAPEPKGGEVLFRESAVYNGRALTVIVDKRSGQINRIE